MTTLSNRPAGGASPLLSAPILPTLARLSLPNAVSMLAVSAVTIAETAYVGQLGTVPLAAMALVFPVVMLLQMMATGAMGGGISSAVARAIGARDVDRASALALHAVVIAIGGGDVARARRVAWTAAALAFALTGAIGLVVALAPQLWSRLFTSEAAVLACADSYLRIAGPAFALFGLAHCLYFASQGSGRILPLVLAQSTRLLTVIGGALWVVQAGPTPARVFTVAAIGMLAYGIAAMIAMHASRWGR